jgi:hypothetical protein
MTWKLALVSAVGWIRAPVCQHNLPHTRLAVLEILRAGVMIGLEIFVPMDHKLTLIEFVVPFAASQWKALVPI